MTFCKLLKIYVLAFRNKINHTIYAHLVFIYAVTTNTLLYSAVTILEFVIEFFRLLISHFVSSSGHGHLRPLYNKSDPTSASNCRPITLLDLVSID